MTGKRAVTWNGQWHPLAERFAMLTEDELRTMAASIGEHGQFVPCGMDGSGLGLDGRNRVAACGLAGVDPRWEVIEGDAIAYIVEVNAERRSWSTGQRAMATALGLVAAGQRMNGHFKRGSIPANTGSGVSRWAQRVTEAGVVLDHADELVDRVLGGELALDAAHRTAVERRDRRSRIDQLGGELGKLIENDVITLEEAERRVEHDERVAELPPDLAQRVVDQSLALDEAELIRDERRQRVLIDVERIQGAMRTIARMANNPIADDLAAELEDDEMKLLTTLINALEGGDYGFMG